MAASSIVHPYPRRVKGDWFFTIEFLDPYEEDSMKKRQSYRGSAMVVLGTLLVTLCISMPMAFGQASKEKFPTKPITLVAPNKPGVSTDVAARAIQPFLSKNIGVPVVVENKDGGAYMIGRGYVFRADPDGYTLLVSATQSMAIAELMSDKPAYKSKEMASIFNLTGGDPQGIWVRADSPYKTMADLKAASQTKDLKHGFAGIGSNGQLVGALLRQQGLKSKPIPYEQVLLALLSDEVDWGITRFFAVPKDEKGVRCLGITAPKRLMEFPEVPTIMEQGFNMDMTMRNAIFGPPGIPADRVAILEGALRKAVADPDYMAIVKKQGLEVEPLGTIQLSKHISEVYELVQNALPLLKAGPK